MQEKKLIVKESAELQFYPLFRDWGSRDLSLKSDLNTFNLRKKTLMWNMDVLAGAVPWLEAVSA